MIINLEALNKALYLESCGKDDTLYISIEDLNKALKIAIANTNIEKEIDNENINDIHIGNIGYKNNQLKILDFAGY